jgi:DNA-binding GntR family transcriptional regulator
MIAASKGGDMQRRIHLNIAFHEKFVETSGNKLLVQLYNYMHFGNWSLLTGSLSEMDPIQIATRHRILIDALRARDPDRVAKAVREHIESMTKPLSNMLAKENL